MKIIFFGSSQFAVRPLKALTNSVHKVCCVVTQPDRQSGRGLAMSVTPVKTKAAELNLKIYQPVKINSVQAVDFLKSFEPDIFVVAAYGQILSSEVLAVPKILALNLHASLLPKYRGAAPINWAIIKGEEITGVTAMKMVEEMDAGPLILQKSLQISPSDTAVSLEDKLSVLGEELLLQSIKGIENKTYRLIPQDEKEVSFAPKLQKQNGLINWSCPAKKINNLIRGCLDWPGGFSYYQGKLLKIYNAGICRQAVNSPSRQVGEIIEVTREGIVVACGEDALAIRELQLEGKRKMKVEEFIAGHKVSAGDVLG